jgi:hypothetical protein
MESTLRLLSSYAVILAILAILLAVIVVYSRRQLWLKVSAIALAVGTMSVGYLAFTDLPGRPKYVTIETFREVYHCSKVHYVDQRDRKGFTLIVERHAKSGREYVDLPWNLRLAQSLSKSMRAQAESKRKGAIYYGGASCRKTFDEGDPEGEGEGDGRRKRPGRGLGGDEQEQSEDFGFHAEPPPPAPEKQYE